MSEVYLVSCVAVKRATPSAAQDLYISPWFIKARHYVEMAKAPWFILSAEHGLIAPETVIAPYNRTLNTLGVQERRAWAQGVLRQMETLLPPADDCVVLAGARYRENLMPYLRRRFAKVSVPLEGLPIGRQLSWFNHAAAG